MDRQEDRGVTPSILRLAAAWLVTVAPAPLDRTARALWRLTLRADVIAQSILHCIHTRTV